MSCWICMRMKPARVLSVLRFLGTTKEIDGLRKKPPCTHSTTSRFLTSSGLDHFVKETRERVIRLDSCNPSLGDRFKAVCCDYRSTFFFSMLQPHRRQNNTKNSANITVVRKEKEGGSLKPSYIPTNHATDVLLFAWQVLLLWAQNSSQVTAESSTLLSASARKEAPT